MIIIAGDSWACGEWIEDSFRNPNQVSISHGGLAQYLCDHGYRVLNLGIPAGSNAQTLNKLNHFFLANTAIKNQIQSIIIIQTEWHRDFRDLNTKTDTYETFKLFGYDGLDPTKDIFNQLSISNTQNFHSITISHFYNQLQKLTEIYQLNSKIYLIGGCSDIMIDVISNDCYNIEVMCKSWVDLCLNENNSPILDYQIPLDLLNFMKKKFNDLDYIIEWMTDCETRKSKFHLNKNFFYPDGWHPNRIAHKILFDFIMQKNYFI